MISWVLYFTLVFSIFNCSCSLIVSERKASVVSVNAGSFQYKSLCQSHFWWKVSYFSWNVVGREVVWRVPVHRCMVTMRLKNVYDDDDDQGLGSCCVLTTDECGEEISRNRTYIQRHFDHLWSLIVFYIWSSFDSLDIYHRQKLSPREGLRKKYWTKFGLWP